MGGAVIVLFFIAFFYLVYKNIAKANQYWKVRGVPYVSPRFFFGNFASNIFQKASFGDVLRTIYLAFPTERFVGLYQFTQPVLMVRDPELIKRITVKDFEYFSDHTQYIAPDVDPLWGRNLFSLSVKDGWHDMRTMLSPTFTSSKMRIIFSLMQECVKEFVSYLNTKGDTMTLELKDTFSRVANDIIGTTAFGVECNSLKNRHNEFYMMGKQITSFSGIRGLKFFAYATLPKLMKYLNVKLISTTAAKFFTDVITDTLRYREKNNVIRPDMLYLLTEVRKERMAQGENSANVKHHKIELTDDLITAQAMIFFFAGFDTVSTALSLMFYELAINSQIQDELFAEIRQTVGEQITYEKLLSMKFLDCVVSESLRLHPPGIFMDRRCVKPYVIEPEKARDPTVRLEKGDLIWIPIRELHRDPNNYPEPKKFDPGRFSSANKDQINPFTFLPFGLGPRNCIASRFALLECKLVLVEVLKQYEVVPVSKTEIPLTLSKKSPIPLPENGVWVGFNRRVEDNRYSNE
ncbi:hypothetical protein PPYR_07901 [Photinus pyralis]|uniref:Cytochrome P450 n=1 Tax=Photinus pyralis TaxID=7054 RepID=A0A1Y1LNF0_PHOPY|nr:cytochrome P450 9e2-like [Photinus pyralis]KAB0800021.1 hypothetical protein PPYR_07901 [Photinus pyralis]